MKWCNEWSLVEYEMRMLGYTDGVIHGTGDPEEELKDALLESFLIHARNLIKFLFFEKDVPNDITAQTFLNAEGSLKWKESCGLGKLLAHKNYLKDLLRPINKRLAHITRDRLLYPDRRWYRADISLNIQRCWEEFLRIKEAYPISG